MEALERKVHDGEEGADEARQSIKHHAPKSNLQRAIKRILQHMTKIEHINKLHPDIITNFFRSWPIRWYSAKTTAIYNANFVGCRNIHLRAKHIGCSSQTKNARLQHSKNKISRKRMSPTHKRCFELLFSRQ